MAVDLSTYNNQWYQPGPVIRRVCWYIISLVFFKNGLFPFYGLKTFLLRSFGATIGTGVFIKPDVSIKYPWFLVIGDHCWIGEKVWIDNLGKLVIGNHVCISQGALLLSGNHDYTKPGFDLLVKPIIIEDGAWIGARAIVCGGAVCRTHSVLTAGSVTSGELQANGIYQGNPGVWVRGRSFEFKV